ncbi:MAG: nucleotidyltransferase domain-containing protein [Deltaproteobacteria bacterium]|nr:nucleotidyltransferase domain-containing protein [Deltaproteobacteria bacterium]
MVEREIVEAIKGFAKKIRQRRIRISKVILYGSRASGTARKYSDIDVAVVSPDFGKDSFREGVKLFEIAGEVDPRIEPVPLSVESYKNDTWIPLIYEIRKTGLEIKTA